MATLHRNCIHVCHVIYQDYSAPFQDGIPRTVQVDSLYLSPQCPAMTLSKYISTTRHKHSRYSEVYEREVLMILLQVLKGVRHLHDNNTQVTSVEPSNIFLLHQDGGGGVYQPHKQLRVCPTVALSSFPRLSTQAHHNEVKLCHQMAFLVLDLLHCPYDDVIAEEMVVEVPVESSYSRHLQHVVDRMLEGGGLTSVESVVEMVLFGPSDLGVDGEDETLGLINKWHSRRCVDMVTQILKRAPLVMLCTSQTNEQHLDKMKDVDQEVLLECEFLSNVTAQDIYRVSKMLER